MAIKQSRIEDLQIFYKLLALLEEKIGGKKLLSDLSIKNSIPKQGVYFFFEKGEERSISGSGLRVVRVGTHAVSNGSKTTLWHRLRQHRGNIGGSHPGGGNHRGSIFRLHVGSALINKEKWMIYESWGKGSNAPRQIRESEFLLECTVSATIGTMPFLFLKVEDTASVSSMRGVIERNSIALLSNCTGEVDKPSNDWLGQWADRPGIRASGLWNVNYINDEYDPAFLMHFRSLVENHSYL